MDQSKVFSQREEAYPKGGKIPEPKGEKYLSESSHEGESKGESWL